MHGPLTRRYREQRREPPLQPLNLNLAALKLRVVHHAQMKFARRLNAIHRQLAQRATHPRHRRGAIRRPHNELGEHRIIKQSNLRTGLYPTVPSHAGAARELQMRNAADGRQESIGRIFTRNTALHRPAVRFKGAREGQLFAGRDSDLPLHKVHSRHQLSDGVFNLNAGVHFEKIKLAAFVEQELARARIGVTGRASGAHRRLTHALSQLGRHRHTRRFLNHFLVAALHGTLPLTEREHVAVLVRQHLNLDVPRPLDVLLDVHRVVTKSVLGLTLGGIERADDFIRTPHDAHPLATTASRRLEQHRIPKLRGNLGRLSGITQCRGRAWHHGHLMRHRKLACGRFASHRRNGFRGWPHPHEPRIPHGTRKPLTLAQKTIAWMNGFGTGGNGRRNNRVAKQVTLRRGRRSEAHRFVGFAHMRRTRVSIGIDRDRQHPQLAAGPHHAQCDLAAIGDQQFTKHGSARPPAWHRRSG